MLFCAVGCTGDFDRINRNPSEATDEELQRENYKIGTNIRGLQNLVVPVQEHRYQFNESLTGNPFAGYMGETPDGWKEKFSTFNPSADWLRWPFVIVMQEVYPYYRGVVNNTDDEVALALAKLLRVAIMHRMTDTYGPIPYSKVVDDSSESLTVAYDTQEEVYTKMFEGLDEAMRLSYVKPDVAKAKASEAIADGVIATNADNARMTAPENRVSLIYNDWGDHRVGADIISYMNGFNDPRRAVLFTQGTWNKKSDYYGMRIGTDPTNKAVMVSTYSNQIVDSKTPYLWFNAAEAAFLQAEWELRWGTADAAKSRVISRARPVRPNISTPWASIRPPHR